MFERLTSVIEVGERRQGTAVEIQPFRFDKVECGVQTVVGKGTKLAQKNPRKDVTSTFLIIVKPLLPIIVKISCSIQ